MQLRLTIEMSPGCPYSLAQTLDAFLEYDTRHTDKAKHFLHFLFSRHFFSAHDRNIASAVQIFSPNSGDLDGVEYQLLILPTVFGVPFLFCVHLFSFGAVSRQ